MLADAAKHPGREVCGLLLGPRPANAAAVAAVHIAAVLPTANVAAAPARNFEIDPAALLRAHREARGRGETVIGHYHSHPDGDGQPSRRDAARASENGQLWLIIAAGSITAWRAVADDPAALHRRFLAVALADAG